MQQLMSIISWLVIVVWVGGLIALGALFAPITFRRLSSRADAGGVIGAVIARLEAVGLVASGILLMATVVQAMDRAWVQVDLIRVLLVTAMLVLTLLSATVLRPKIEAVRSQMTGPLDAIPEDDPVRMEHRRLHRISVLLFQGNVLLGLALVVLSALREF